MTPDNLVVRIQLPGKLLINAMDGRKVITVNIPGAFLQGDWSQDEHPGYIMLKGIMVDMICEIDPSYHDKIISSKDRKQKFLYVGLIKAVYGTLLGAIIFYNKLSKYLTDHGYAQNEYDMCTFNKIVNGGVSHKDQAVLEDFLDELRSELGQEGELKENKGLMLEYLDITIDYLIAGKVVFTMFDYLEDVIIEAADDLKNSRSYYPRNNQLFKVDDDSPRLHSIKGQENISSTCRETVVSSKIDSKLETPVELSTSQLEIRKVIILHRHFKEIHSTLIVKLSWG